MFKITAEAANGTVAFEAEEGRKLVLCLKITALIFCIAAAEMRNARRAAWKF